jgi:hypothetical protein
LEAGGVRIDPDPSCVRDPQPVLRGDRERTSGLQLWDASPLDYAPMSVVERAQRA